MKIIKLYDTSTYPYEIIKLCRDFKENRSSFLFKDISIEIKNTLDNILENVPDNKQGQFNNILMSLKNILENCEITGYHITRVHDINTLLTKGLIFSNDEYINIIANSLISHEFSDSQINEIKQILTNVRDNRYSKTPNDPNTSNEPFSQYNIHFLFNKDKLSGYEEYYATYGGELMSDVLGKLKQMSPIEGKPEFTISECQKIAKIGTPCIIEFSFPFKQFGFEQETVILHIFQKLICSDNDNIKDDIEGRLPYQIPPDKIIEIHEIKDVNESYLYHWKS